MRSASASLARATSTQLRKLALERLIAIAQHFHLALDQAHRRARVAQVRQAELGEQGAVALEEIRIGLQDTARRCASLMVSCLMPRA